MPRTLQHIHDELLVIRCQDGEADALHELIALWRAPLRAHAWNLTRDPEAAADICQEAWLAIAGGLGRLSDPSRFGPWAYRIVTNKCADWARARQRRRAVESQTTDPDAGSERPNRHNQDSGESHRLRAGLAALKPEQRAILSMHYLVEMNVNQIAIALDIPVGTVKSRLYHAREKLKAAFERQTP